MVRTFLRVVLPSRLRRAVRRKFDSTISQLKAPRMVWGYHDSSGAWRPRMRISDTVFMYHPQRVFIADNVFVWHYTILDGTGGLEIGEGHK